MHSSCKCSRCLTKASLATNLRAVLVCLVWGPVRVFSTTNRSHFWSPIHKKGKWNRRRKERRGVENEVPSCWRHSKGAIGLEWESQANVVKNMCNYLVPWITLSGVVKRNIFVIFRNGNPGSIAPSVSIAGEGCAPFYGVQLHQCGRNIDHKSKEGTRQ